MPAAAGSRGVEVANTRHAVPALSLEIIAMVEVLRLNFGLTEADPARLCRPLDIACFVSEIEDDIAQGR